MADEQVKAPERLSSGEVVMVGGAFFKVRIDVEKTGSAAKYVLEPTGDGRLSKAPWRIIQHSHQGKWVPAIIDDKERLVALVFGKDEAQKDANAAALLQAHLYQAVAK